MQASRFALPLSVALIASAGLAGCSSVKVWPFDDKGSNASTQKRGPANATEYQCAAGKRFFVRTIDNGSSVWLIYPDREVALSKASSGNRYTNGIATLDLGNGEATLIDGPTINYSGCKAGAAK